MNNALKEIAKKYCVAEESIPEILAGMKIKDAQKPSKAQLEGFEKICTMLQEGKPMDEAIRTLLDSAKNGLSKEAQTDGRADTATDTLDDAELDNFILTQAERAADAALASLPSIAFSEHQRLRGLFVQRYRQRLAELLQNPEFLRQFNAAIEGQDVGKLNLLNSMTSNIRLLSSSSSSS